MTSSFWRRALSSLTVALVTCVAPGSAAHAASIPTAANAAPVTLETNDARVLYDAAYDRWRALPRPAFATYRETVRIVRGGRTTLRRDDIAYRQHDKRCLVVGVPLDTRDRPDAPRVTDRCFAPDFSFTFLPDLTTSGGPLPIDFATPGPEPSDGPRTIGRVSARARAYDATYVGDEQLGAARTAHLALRPFGDPNKHALRDIWIDRATRGIVRLHGDVGLAVHFASVDFTVDFDETETTQVVRHVAGYAKAQLLLIRLGADFDLTLAHDAYPATLPSWYFERNGYTSHHSPTIASVFVPPAQRVVARSRLSASANVATGNTVMSGTMRSSA